MGTEPARLRIRRCQRGIFASVTLHCDTHHRRVCSTCKLLVLCKYGTRRGKGKTGKTIRCGDESWAWQPTASSSASVRGSMDMPTAARRRREETRLGGTPPVCTLTSDCAPATPSSSSLAHLHLETREPESSPSQGREARRGRCRWSRSVRISRNRDLAGQVHRRKEGPQLMHNGRQDVTVTGSRTAPCPTGTGRQPIPDPVVRRRSADQRAMLEALPRGLLGVGGVDSRDAIVDVEERSKRREPVFGPQKLFATNRRHLRVAQIV